MVRRGAQGAIVGLLLATMTFPSFSQLSITAAIGLLLALAISPQSAPGEDAAPLAGPSTAPGSRSGWATIRFSRLFSRSRQTRRHARVSVSLGAR